MNMLSVAFVVFIIALFIALKLSKKELARQNILLIASYIFYAYADIRFLPILLFQTVVAYCAAKAFSINRLSIKRLALLLSITLEIGVLAIYKYSGLLINNGCGGGNLTIALPLGLSFYTFQAVSYIIDAYQGKIHIEKSFKKVALYIGFFPQITSGPIVKAHDFLKQLEQQHPVKMQNIADGAQIFLMGIVKKIVIADRLGRAVDAVYAAPHVYSGMSILVTTLAYSIQIYCDFSGYSDMAVGIARALGYDIGRNFNLPYIAQNPAEFWKRWHISLSSWLKEYVYIPLGGSRRGIKRTCINLLIVMLLSGIWHGAGWTFVLWGLYHGIGSVVHKLFKELVNQRGWHIQSSAGKRLSKGVSIILTFLFVNLGWVLFRADSIETALTFVYRMFVMADGVHYIYVYTIIFLILLAVVCIYTLWKKEGEVSYLLLDYNKFSSWFILWTVILLTLAFFYHGDTAFIYGGF
ncbi:MAG: MBOAT family protein [Butyrivibrio sp.]|nr:MBOAT family protein [Butyrivibrio sp.]